MNLKSPMTSDEDSQEESTPLLVGPDHREHNSQSGQRNVLLISSGFSYITTCDVGIPAVFYHHENYVFHKLLTGFISAPNLPSDKRRVDFAATDIEIPNSNSSLHSSYSSLRDGAPSGKKFLTKIVFFQ